MENTTNTAPQQAPTEQPASIPEDTLVIRCQTLVRDFDKLEERINLNRDALLLDITSEEARRLGIVEGNEAYIGRRVIASNIKRELPVFIEYLAGSHRHIAVRGRDAKVPMHVCAQLEQEFTQAFRQGDWLLAHLQAVVSMELHGRGVLLLVPAPDSPLGVKLSYVPPEDFIFPTKVRDIQAAPMLAIGYTLTHTQFISWARTYNWRPEAYSECVTSTKDDDVVNKPIRVYRVMYRQNGAVYGCWYFKENSKLLTAPELFNTGFYNPDGTVMPRDTYPVFPLYYNITETLEVAERMGRAHEDMHDQEAITLMTTAGVNGLIRSSELYIADMEQGATESPEVTQDDTIIKPGRVIKRKVQFFTPPAPDSNIILMAQALRSENASQAGQVDFAAQARKDSRKTAKELSLAETQTAQVQTVSLTSFSSCYRAALQYVWDCVANNITVGVNKRFLADQEVLHTTIATVPFFIAPAGDIDVLERNKLLQQFMQFFPLFQSTSVGTFFLDKILELAFPMYYAQLSPKLQDNSKQMGAALYHLVASLPPNMIPPEMQPKLQEIMAEAAKAFNVTPETASPRSTGPAMG